jgi:hypothetical protein
MSVSIPILPTRPCLYICKHTYNLLWKKNGLSSFGRCINHTLSFPERRTTLHFSDSMLKYTSKGSFDFIYYLFLFCRRNAIFYHPSHSVYMKLGQQQKRTIHKAINSFKDGSIGFFPDAVWFSLVGNGNRRVLTRVNSFFWQSFCLEAIV